MHCREKSSSRKLENLLIVRLKFVKIKIIAERNQKTSFNVGPKKAFMNNKTLTTTDAENIPIILKNW